MEAPPTQLLLPPQPKKKGRPLKFARRAHDLVECVGCKHVYTFMHIQTHQVGCGHYEATLKYAAGLPPNAPLHEVCSFVQVFGVSSHISYLYCRCQTVTPSMVTFVLVRIPIFGSSGSCADLLQLMRLSVRLKT